MYEISQEAKDRLANDNYTDSDIKEFNKALMSQEFVLGKIFFSNPFDFVDDKTIEKLISEGKNLKNNPDDFFVENLNSEYYSIQLKFDNGGSSHRYLHKNIKLEFGFLLGKLFDAHGLKIFYYYLENDVVIEVFKEYSVDDLKIFYNRIKKLMIIT